ncbi:MAG: 7-carboxy-7-deazaguanine synthase QueE [bacterium]|nr:7-carboxy-7-deazaguanine synthase QueE [bacterium]
MTNTALAISEQFISLQGEGPYTGVSAIFLRLKGCNLLCGGQGTIESKKPEGRATWRCDTIEVWREGTTVSISSLCDEWHKKGWIDALKKGTHLVITGGEPLLQINGILNLLETLENTYRVMPFVEFETNGTLSPTPLLIRPNCHFNVSPKLSSSGVNKTDRLNEDVLRDFCECERVCFKFVVCQISDCDEIEAEFFPILNRHKSHLFLMPGADNRDALVKLLPKVATWSQKWGVKLSTRLHIHAWNQKTGV